MSSSDPSAAIVTRGDRLRLLDDLAAESAPTCASAPA